mmetsp:Transcript_67156/g.149836  ORF Transcript_67156/g.149836 Transcript_67156/m.149836 type:complete len:279 (-) Transcript_67156:255-1091(-)
MGGNYAGRCSRDEWPLMSHITTTWFGARAPAPMRKRQRYSGATTSNVHPADQSERQTSVLPVESSRPHGLAHAFVDRARGRCDHPAHLTIRSRESNEQPIEEARGCDFLRSNLGQYGTQRGGCLLTHIGCSLLMTDSMMHFLCSALDSNHQVLCCRSPRCSLFLARGLQPPHPFARQAPKQPAGNFKQHSIDIALPPGQADEIWLGARRAIGPRDVMQDSLSAHDELARSLLSRGACMALCRTISQPVRNLGHPELITQFIPAPGSHPRLRKRGRPSH